MINKDNLPLANIKRYKLQIHFKLMFKGFEEHIEGKRGEFLKMESKYNINNYK